MPVFKNKFYNGNDVVRYHTIPNDALNMIDIKKYIDVDCFIYDATWISTILLYKVIEIRNNRLKVERIRFEDGAAFDCRPMTFASISKALRSNVSGIKDDKWGVGYLKNDIRKKKINEIFN